MQTCAVFDLDGVLIDSREAVKRSYADVGVTMPRSAWGTPWQSWLPELYDGDVDRALEVHDRKNRVYPKFLRDHAQPLPLAHYLNHLLRCGFPVFVLTGASHDAAVAAMNRIKVDLVTLFDYEMTIKQKSAALSQFCVNDFEYGVYYDDQDGVVVPDGWAFAKVI